MFLQEAEEALSLASLFAFLSETNPSGFEWSSEVREFSAWQVGAWILGSLLSGIWGENRSRWKS